MAEPNQVEPKPGASAGAGSAGGWTLPESYKGKSLEDVARMHQELEQKFGQQGEELGKVRGLNSQWQEWSKGWAPVHERYQHDPSRAVEELQRIEQQAKAQGDRQTAAQARRAWHEIADPQEQGRYLEQFRDEAVQLLAQRQEEQLKGLQGYIDQWMNQGLELMDLRMQHPGLTSQQLLAKAVELRKSPMSPLQMAAQMLAAPQQAESWLKQHDAEQKKIWQDEQAKKTQTAGVGGKYGPTETHALAPIGKNGKPDTSSVPFREQALERAAARVRKLLPPE